LDQRHHFHGELGTQARLKLMAADRAVRRRLRLSRLIRFVGALVLGAALASLLLVGAAGAEETAPANSLPELQRQFSSCLAKSSLVVGSQITIRFAVRRDGSAFGKPRVTYSHLVGEADQKRRFPTEVGQAIDSCLPLRVTQALGEAIAGRLFSVTLGAPKAERAI
jgi:hypothetical protein